MENRSMFVGLDVHKETIDVSIAEGHREGEVRHYGVIASDLEPLDKVVRALHAPDRQPHFENTSTSTIRSWPLPDRTARRRWSRESVAERPRHTSHPRPPHSRVPGLRR